MKNGQQMKNSDYVPSCFFEIKYDYYFSRNMIGWKTSTPSHCEMRNCILPAGRIAFLMKLTRADAVQILASFGGKY